MNVSPKLPSKKRYVTSFFNFRKPDYFHVNTTKKEKRHALFLMKKDTQTRFFTGSLKIYPRQ